MTSTLLSNFNQNVCIFFDNNFRSETIFQDKKNSAKNHGEIFAKAAVEVSLATPLFSDGILLTPLVFMLCFYCINFVAFTKPD